MGALRPHNNPRKALQSEPLLRGEITRLLQSRETYRRGSASEHDDELFRATQAELLKRFSRVLWHGDFSGIRHRTTPEDLLSEFCLRFCTAEFRTPANSREFYSWAETIVRNMLRDAGRAARSKKRFNSRLKQPLTDVDLRGPMSVEKRAELNLVIGRLEKREAEAFTLVVIQGFSLEEAATQLKTSTKTVKRRVGRARLSLRCMLSGIDPNH